jgi:hypothetical protein
MDDVSHEPSLPEFPRGTNTRRGKPGAAMNPRARGHCVAWSNTSRDKCNDKLGEREAAAADRKI